MDIEKVTFSGEIDAEKFYRLVVVAQELGLRVVNDAVNDETDVFGLTTDSPAEHIEDENSTVATGDQQLDTTDYETTPKSVSKKEFFEYARTVLPESESERETRARFSSLTRTWFGLARISHAVQQDIESGIVNPLVKELGYYPEFGILPVVEEKSHTGGEVKISLDEQNADDLDFESAVNYIVTLSEKWIETEKAYGNTKSMQQFINDVKPGNAVGSPGLAALANYLSTKSNNSEVVERLQRARDFFVDMHKEISKDGQTWLTFAN